MVTPSGDEAAYEPAPAPDEIQFRRRARMVQVDLQTRGIRDRGVLDAMATVPRERFLPPELDEFAYDDHPLPIAGGQTISQPYIVAAMAQAAEIRPTDRVLEIGTGSGYGAAVLGRVGGQVWTVERLEDLAHTARRRLDALGYGNVVVIDGDGSLGWPDAAPFDAIVVTAGGPSVPRALRSQLADRGRMVIPVGPDGRDQRLLRVRRDGSEFHEEDLGPVRFVPLVGAQAWPERSTSAAATPKPLMVATDSPLTDETAAIVREAAHPFTDIDTAELGPLLERIGDARVVLVGEASHGTSEFYRMRDRITRALIVHKGFTAVAVEADWPDAARVDAHVNSRPPFPPAFTAFSRFPTWMWRNREVAEFTEWLTTHNRSVQADQHRVSFHGLDLYSLFTSRDAVIEYLAEVDPPSAELARHRYSCLSPWQHDPAAYGRAVVTGRFRGCEDGVVDTLTDLLRQRLAYAAQDGDAYVNALQNAVVVADAEKYYRAMYYGSVESWNLRDQHMFEALQLVRAHRGPDTKVVVWEHNSHIGDASATEMGTRGEHNVGQLCRREYGGDAYLIGFGTDHGTVAAASDWGGPMHRMSVRPSHRDSYERVFHDAGVPAFLLHLREPDRLDVREALGEPRLERAIGVIYRPETELASHYFQARLPRQFDEYVWMDATTAVTPLATHELSGPFETYPSGV